MGIRNSWRAHLIRRYERKLAKLRGDDIPVDPSTSSVYSQGEGELLVNRAQFFGTQGSTATTRPGPVVDTVTRHEFNRLQVELAEQFTLFRTEVREVLDKLSIHHSTPMNQTPNVSDAFTPTFPSDELDQVFEPTEFDKAEESSLFEASPEVVQPLRSIRRPLNDVGNALPAQNPLFKWLAT